MTAKELADLIQRHLADEARKKNPNILSVELIAAGDLDPSGRSVATLGVETVDKGDGRYFVTVEAV